MKLIKINGRMAGHLRRYDSNSYAIISAGRSYIYDLYESSIVWTSEHLRNMCSFTWNDDKSVYLFSNTSGKTVMYDAYTGQQINSFGIGHEPYVHAFAQYGKEFVFFDKNRNIKITQGDKPSKTIFDNDTGEMFQNVVRVKDKLYLTIDSFDCSGISEICCSYDENNFTVIKKDTIEKELLVCKYLVVYDDNIYFSCIDFRMEESSIVKYDCDNMLFSEFMPFPNFNIRGLGYFVRFKISPDGTKTAFLFSDILIVVDNASAKMIRMCEVKFSMDIDWIDNETMLFGAMNGLFKVVL